MCASGSGSFHPFGVERGVCCFPLLYFVRVHRCTDEDLVWEREGLLIAAACILGFNGIAINVPVEVWRLGRPKTIFWG